MDAPPRPDHDAPGAGPVKRDSPASTYPGGAATMPELLERKLYGLPDRSRDRSPIYRGVSAPADRPSQPGPRAPADGDAPGSERPAGDLDLPQAVPRMGAGGDAGATRRADCDREWSGLHQPRGSRMGSLPPAVA